jgi:hypothetical protein
MNTMPATMPAKARRRTASPGSLARRAYVAGTQALEAALEPAEEAFLLAVMHAQDDRCQRGRQRQCHDPRDHHRDRDRDRELLVQLAGDPAQEGDRQEHRD